MSMTAITLNQLTALSDLAEINRALRDDLVGRDPQTIATTEINGGDIATIVDDQGTPQTVAQVLAEVDAFLDDGEPNVAAGERGELRRGAARTPTASTEP